MIKLNNKNITYVALADSSNSLKAPKEIWYADTNNSVKLVYRRKDALIEGVDYEKYHWLKGDGNTYINTLVSDLTNVDTITCYFYWYGDVSSNNRIFGRESPKSFTCGVDFTVSKLSIWIESPYSQLNLNNGEDYFEVDLVNQKISTSLQTSWISPITEITGTSFYLFGDHGYNKIFSGKIKSFIIGNKLNLIPCKLLKPVPKWLDANGIRRQVGECGMIDLVSGKFYGNVNSVGTFTVENYYERKEWLVGDGNAYIDTGHNVNEDLDYETKAHLLPNTYLFWYRTNSASGDNTMVVRSNTTYWIGQRVANNSYDKKLTDTNDAVEVKWNGEYVDINGIEYHITKNIRLNHNFNLFYIRLESSQDASSYTSNNVKCSYFRFLDSNRNYILNLIPCTLTMDLPASMDANNIARTKGTSGMWDLVSDKFYGNVANSGTFKAVNLAEGVDYEVHQWLVGDGTAYIDTNIIPLTTSLLLDFYCTKPSTNCTVCGSQESYGNTDGSTTIYYTNNKFRFDILSIGTDYIYLDGNDTNHIVVDTDANTASNNGVIVSSTKEYNAASKTFKIFWTNYAGSYFLGGIGTFNFNDSINQLNLVPVKLLHSIPPKYDANGIARQAGECGMYDTVNDVFYGNVASSGTFSVSDDS